MNIRPATMDDYAQLCELFDEVDRLHRETRPDVFRKPDGPVRSRERIAHLVDGSDAAILVAERDGMLSGLAVVLEIAGASHPLRVDRRVVEIGTIVVRADARRQGIGRSLMAASLQWAKVRGADHVEISVYAFNEDALRMYEAAGFTMLHHRLKLPI
jgi:GNAT superfamily N-acetyltransferase